MVCVQCLYRPPSSLILPSQDEGGFAWLTLNYLLGKLGKHSMDTVAAIDLGGGSVRMGGDTLGDSG